MNSSSISQSIPPGSDVTIRCEFEGNPRPDPSAAVEWYRDGVKLDSNSGVSTSMFDSSLTIQNFRASAVYQCHVTNVHGSDTASVFLCLQRQGRLAVQLHTLNL